MIFLLIRSNVRTTITLFSAINRCLELRTTGWFKSLYTPATTSDGNEKSLWSLCTQTRALGGPSDLQLWHVWFDDGSKFAGDLIIVLLLLRLLIEESYIYIILNMTLIFRFENKTRDLLFWLRANLVFLSPFRKMSGQHFKFRYFPIHCSQVLSHNAIYT